MGVHQAFGLTWMMPCDFDRFPMAAVHGRAAIDVCVAESSIAAPPPGAEQIGPLRWLDGERLTFVIPAVGRIRVCSGDLVQVDRDPDCDVELLTLMLAGPVAGVVLGRRGMLPVHGAAVEGPRGAAVLIGAPSAGVSTTAGALMNAGYRLLGDELLALRCDGGSVAGVVGGWNTLQLPVDSAARLGLRKKDVTRSRAGLGRFDLPVRPQAGDPIPVDTIYLLKPAKQQRFSLVPVRGEQQFEALLDANWDRPVRAAMGCYSDDWLLAARIASGSRTRRLERPVTDRVRTRSLLSVLERDLNR